MNISDDELLSIIEDTTLALGEILLRHRELSENFLDIQQTDQAKEKIDSLRKQIEDESENLAKIRQSQQRKKELERIRRGHEKEAKQTQTEQKSGMVFLVAWCCSHVCSSVFSLGFGRTERDPIG